jgi:hypothetical protein
MNNLLPTVPEVSGRLLDRLYRLYRHIEYHSRKRGYCWASSPYLIARLERREQIHASAATLRRWIAILVEHGWVEVVKQAGPIRHIKNATDPGIISRLLGRFKRSFERVLSGVLSGSASHPPLLTESTESNNTQGVDAVVMEAKKLGMDARAAMRFALEKGVDFVREQFRIVAAQGSEIRNPGAMAYRRCENAWPLPWKVAKLWGEQERREEREQAVERRIVRARVQESSPQTTPPAPLPRPLLEAAMAGLLSELPAGPERSFLEKRGISAASVQVRARKLMEDAKNGTGGG